MTASNVGFLKFPDLKTKFVLLGGCAADLKNAGGGEKADYVKAVLFLIQRHSTMVVVEPGSTARKTCVVAPPAAAPPQKRRRSATSPAAISENEDRGEKRTAI